MGFLTKEDWFSPAVLYLYQIADALIHQLSKQSDIEFTREEAVITLTEEEIREWKEAVPFVIGMEYVDEEWLKNLFNKLLNYDGTVAFYFAEHNSKINVAGRIFFHLVESASEDYPFAFMATYSTKPVKSKRAIHTPLKNALIEFIGQTKNVMVHKFVTKGTIEDKIDAMIEENRKGKRKGTGSRLWPKAL